MTSPVSKQPGQGLGIQGTTARDPLVHPQALEIQSQKFNDAFSHLQEQAWQDVQGTWSAERLKQWIPKILGESDWQVTAGFFETEVELPDSAYGLILADGARLCLGMQAREHRLSVPQPVVLDGFAASAWIFAQPLNGVVTDDAGRAGVTATCFRGAIKDITEEILSSPLGNLFPSGRIEPVSQQAVITLLEKFLPGNAQSPSATSGPMSAIIDHLDRLILSGLIYQNAKDSPDYFAASTGAVCHGAAASLKANLNVPMLKLNLNKGGFKDFNFQGIEEFSLHWPIFPLTKLLSPSNFKVESGNLRLDAHVNPGQSSLTIELNFDHLKLKNNLLWGDEEISLHGKFTVVLFEGGIIRFTPKNLNIKIPKFPSKDFPIASLEATLTGALFLKIQPDDSIELFQSKIEAKDFLIENISESAWKFPGIPGVIQGKLQGDFGLTYDPTQPQAELTPSFKLQGQIQLTPDDNKKIEQVKFEEFQLNGTLPLTRHGDSWQPNLSVSTLHLQSDLSLKRKGADFISAEGIFLKIDGGEKTVTVGEVLERATLNTGAAGVYVGQFAWKPEVRLDLESRRSPGSFLLEGRGSWDLDSLTPKVTLPGDAKIIPPLTDLGSPIILSTDGKDLHWSLTMDRPQKVGPIELDGSIKLEGINGNVKLETLDPLTVSFHGDKIAKRLKISGSRNDKRTVLRMNAGNLADKVRGGLGIQILQDGRLSGSYHFSPFSKLLPKGKEFSVTSAKVKGTFSTPPWEEMLEKPQVYLRGQGSAHVNGITQGEINTRFGATLLYQPSVERQTPRGPREYPANFQLVFSRRRPSQLEWGPFLNSEGQEWFRGSAQMKGTLVLTPLKNQIIVGGSHLGITDGTLFWEGHSDPALSQMTLDAEQLWGIQRGVAVGRSLRFETNLNLAPFLKEKAEAVEDQALNRHILYIADRQPLSMEAFWRMLRSHLEGPPAKKGRTP